MSLYARRELLIAVCKLYRNGSKSGNSLILNEFVEASGYNRKYAIGLLQAAADPRLLAGAKRSFYVPRRSKYGQDVEQPLMAVWKVSGGLYPKRLIPFLPDLLDALEREGSLPICPCVKQKLLEMSVATAERILVRLCRIPDLAGTSYRESA